MIVDIHSLAHSYPMDINAPDCMWGEICAVLALVVNNVLRFSYALWVA